MLAVSIGAPTVRRPINDLAFKNFPRNISPGGLDLIRSSLGIFPMVATSSTQQTTAARFQNIRISSALGLGFASKASFFDADGLQQCAIVSDVHRPACGESPEALALR
jgi:hypothetical protein